MIENITAQKQKRRQYCTPSFVVYFDNFVISHQHPDKCTGQFL